MISLCKITKTTLFNIERWLGHYIDFFQKTIISHRIHGTGIFTYTYHKQLTIHGSVNIPGNHGSVMGMGWLNSPIGILWTISPQGFNWPWPPRRPMDFVIRWMHVFFVGCFLSVDHDGSCHGAWAWRLFVMFFVIPRNSAISPAI